MKRKISVTLSPETLVAVDEMVEEGSNRSRVIENAVVEFIERARRRARDERDRKILGTITDDLNRETEDLLEYQVPL